MTHDLRGTPTWNVVEQHFRSIHAPVFGRPHRLAEPSASPDGSRIALTGYVRDELEGRPRQRVHVVDTEGIHPAGSDAHASAMPTWSPDGSRLAMVSDEAEPGVFQLIVVAAADLLASAPQAAPPVPGTVEYLSWAPDATAILIGVAGRGADLAGGAGSGTTKAVSEDHPDWFPHVDTGASDDAWRSVHIFDVATGTMRRWSPPGLNVWEAAWSGSDAVIAVVSAGPTESDWYTATMVRIDSSGSVVDVHRPTDQLGWPCGSPSGDRVAIVEAVCSDRGVVAGDLLQGVPGNLRAVDTLGVDVTSTTWIDDRRIGIAGIRGLETVVAVHDIVTEVTDELWSSTATSCGFRYPEAAWTAAGDAVIVEEGYAQPQRVTVISVDGSSARVLWTNEHPGTEHLLDVGGTAEPISWDAPDGQRIEGVLCTPAGHGPFPLIVNVHGGPVWSFRNSWSMFYPTTPLLVARGYAVLNPNPRGSSGRGQSFARQVFGDMGGADTLDIVSGVDALVARGIADPQRLGVMGGSYGGYMSSWLVTQDRRWAAAVPVSPVTDWYSQHFTSNIPHFDRLFLAGDPEAPGGKFHARSPVLHAGRVRTPCLNIAGADDRCTPPTQALEFHQALLEHGVESSLAIYPGEGHGVQSFPAYIDYATRVLGWFERHMPA